MPYFRVDDKLHDHRKTRRARKGPDGRSAAAIGLWVLAGSWSMANGTDGWVPTDELDRWDADGEQLAEQLVAAELWHPHTRDGEDGFMFHEWDEWQHSQAYLEARRRRKAAHMRTKRANVAAEDTPADQAGQSVDSPHPVHDESTGQSTDGPVTTTPTTTTTTTQDKTPARKRAAAPADKAGDDFAKFWELYPRKTGKQDAARAWMKATAHTDVATIATGLRNAVQVWRTTGTESRFIPNPATWLNQGRWDDEQPLPDMPQDTGPTTHLPCDDPEAHDAHRWSNGRDRCYCEGVPA